MKSTVPLLFIQSIFWLSIAHARVLESPTHQSKTVTKSESQNAFRSPVNDIFNEIGSANQASGDNNKIKDASDSSDSGNRLNGIRNVLNNYDPVMSRPDSGQRNTDTSIFDGDEKNDIGIIHTNQINRLHSGFGMTRQYLNPINFPFTAHNVNLDKAESSEQNTYRRRRSINRPSDYTPTRHREQRGIRSSVADRIAHGFGKRGGDLLLPLTENENEAERRYLGREATATNLDDVFQILLKFYQDIRNSDKRSPYQG